MPIKFLLLGGGSGFFYKGGGGGANFIFMGVGIFPNQGGCKRLFAFVHVCSRLLAFACVLASAFACICQRLSAFCSHLLTPPFVAPPSAWH